MSGLKQAIPKIDELIAQADGLTISAGAGKGVDFGLLTSRMNNQVKLPEPVVNKVLELIQQDNVRSVSCPYDDPELWLSLIAEQVRRSADTGLSPQTAFTLCGPEGGLWDTPVKTMGGEVHIPYEGVCGGDLFIRPSWRRFRAEAGMQTGRLSTAAGAPGCYYVLSPEDFGEVSFASRMVVGDWVLYQSNLPYVQCDPLGRDN